MVGEVADVDPLAPAFAGLPHLVGGFVVGLRRGMLGPAQRDEHVVALGQAGTGPGFATLQADSQVGGQPQGGVGVGVLRRPRDGFAVGLRRVLPGGAGAVVVERRLAVHHQLDRAAHTAHRAQQDVLGVPVHRGAPVGPRARLQVVPGTHDQRVAHDQPAGVGLPRGFQDQAARKVAPGGGNRHPVGTQPEMPGAPVQDGAEHTRGVRPGHTQPLHRARRRDQARGLAVGQECVVRDRGKRVTQRRAGVVGLRCGQGERALAAGHHFAGRLALVHDHLAIINCRAPLRLLGATVCCASFAGAGAGHSLAGWTGSSAGGTEWSCGCPGCRSWRRRPW